MRSLTLLLFLLVGASGAAPQIAWRSDFDAALASAKESGQVLFLALNMDGEKANDRAAEDVYHDKAVVALTESTVNLIGSRFEHGSSTCKRFGVVECGQHQQIEKKIRLQVLQAPPEADIVAPQHIWLSPAGEVLLSVPYELPVPQLLWCFVTALNKADPELKMTMPRSAKVPRRLIMDGTLEPGEGASAIPPMSRMEIIATIRAIRAGMRGESKTKALLRMVSTDDELAIEFIGLEFGDARLGRRPEQLVRYLRAIGVVSPPGYWVAIEDFLNHPDEEVRNEAAVALEQLAAPKSVKKLRAALGREKDTQVRKNMLRAIGVAGAEDKSARTLLLRAWRDRGKDALQARNALLVLGLHATDKKAMAAIEEALVDSDARMRQAAALGLAFARSVDQAPRLRQALEVEKDSESLGVLERCIQVLEGGKLALIAADYARSGKDTIPRTRFFGTAAEEAVKQQD